jgi:hypothetical protein
METMPLAEINSKEIKFFDETDKKRKRLKYANS